MKNNPARAVKGAAMILLCLFFFSCSEQRRTIAIVTGNVSVPELEGMKLVLKNQGFDVKETAIEAVSEVMKNKEADAVWFHRTDTSAFSSEEQRLGGVAREFLAAGGDVFLSMEAFPLVKEWGLENESPGMLVDTVKDEGFGRPLGFHAFKSHPLFNGLSGGVYVSKQPRDHSVRKHGYFSGQVPRGKVVGIQWTYITFTEENKLLLEYAEGKGRLVAAGAYLDYGAENANKKQLELFTGNVFRYMLREEESRPAQYWSYDPAVISAGNAETGNSPLPAAARWALPAPTIEERSDSAGNAFYDLVGRRILWMGKMNSGTDEIWMHPFMALRDLECGVQLKGKDSIHWLKHVPCEVQVAPEYLVRTYAIGADTIKEVNTVAFESPAGVSHLEFTDGVQEIVFRFASSLRYMWPYSHRATGNIRCAYDEGFRAHLFSGQGGALNTVVAYSERPSAQIITSDTALNQAKVEVRFAAPSSSALNLYISGSPDSETDALAVLEKERNELGTLFQQSNAYYKELLNTHLWFDTPDTVFNRGYKWALARTDQFLQTTPGLGTSLMAGFGTTARGWNGRHRISGRPGYAWYFGRDAQWSAMAIDGYGDHKQVKEVLRTFVKFQDLDGKIYHELTSSGVAHYDASDATPLFIVLAAHYLKYSGDIGFIKEIWPALEKALAFCYSTDTDKDGLIENTNVGHGWIEGGPLFGTHTEFYLAGCWAAALEGMAYMAEAAEEKHEEFLAESQKVKQMIDRDFWNSEKSYFYNGKFADGSYMDQSTGFATVPMYLGAVTDSEKSFQVMHRITNSKFSTDWGIRMLEEDNPKYHAGSYHAGMVWPLYTGWGALGAFPNGLYKAGYQYIMNNLLVYKDWALGSVEETLNGEIYKPNGVCSHQCWSETMVLQPAIEGMLGFDPDAVHGSMKLAPYFPWDWKYANVHNIRVGKLNTTMKMKREAGRTGYGFTGSGKIKLHFAPAFPPDTEMERVLMNGKKINFEVVKEADGIRVITDIEWNGDAQLVYEHNKGIGALPVVTIAKLNQPSGGLKILAETAENGKAEWLAEGRPGKTYTFQVFSAAPLKSVENAKLVASEGNLHTLAVSIPAADELYSQTRISASY